DATLDQRRGQGQTGHAGADDGDVDDVLALVLAHRRPARGGKLQAGELVGEAGLERRQAARLGHCAWMRASRTTRPHFSVSAARWSASCCEVPPSAEAPISARRFLTAGSAST